MYKVRKLIYDEFMDLETLHFSSISWHWNIQEESVENAIALYSLSAIFSNQSSRSNVYVWI